MENILDKIISDDNNKILEGLIQLQEQTITEKTVKILIKIFKENDNEMIRERISDIFKNVDSTKLDNELIELFAHEDPIIRNTAITILQNKGEKILSSLEKALENPDKDIRKLVLDTTSKIKSKKNIFIFKKGLKDKDINVVIAATEYIGNLEIKDLRDDVYNLFTKSESPFLKVVALETLSKIGGKEYLDKIKEFLGTDIKKIDSLLLFPFLKCIGEYGDIDDLNLLNDYLKSGETTYLKEITNAIEHIVENKKIKNLPEDVFENLSELLFNKINPINKYGFITFLGLFNNKSLIEILKKCLSDNDRMLVLGALEIIMKKGFEEQFLKEIKEIKEKFGDDEEISELIEDALYFSEEN